MLNNLILVGRVVKQPTPLTPLTIATQRSYKNPDTNKYETDYFDITLSQSLKLTAIDYLREGDIVGVRGHIETEYSNFNEKGIKIICDKLTFLSSTNTTNTTNTTNNMEEN